ncbi:uncharacterized protein TrAtP1_007535 [Trichoderma atroviride]|uniref:uncharacterized protein n=1 Tax=Hypocrea atroviridis TaxID=63577 RepID=UPI00332D2493|nr:hypothetical protein TrAtP1_007535 [Trichoderma atroviride]
MPRAGSNTGTRVYGTVDRYSPYVAAADKRAWSRINAHIAYRQFADPASAFLRNASALWAVFTYSVIRLALITALSGNLVTALDGNLLHPYPSMPFRLDAMKKTKDKHSKTL